MGRLNVGVDVMQTQAQDTLTEARVVLCKTGTVSLY